MVTLEVIRHMSLRELEDLLDQTANKSWRIVIADSIIESESQKNKSGIRLYTGKKIGSKRNAKPIKNHFLVFFECEDDAAYFKLSLKKDCFYSNNVVKYC